MRRLLGPVFLLLLLGGGAHAEDGAKDEGADDLTSSAKLKPWKKKYTYHHRYGLPASVEATDEPFVVSGKLGRRTLLFVDVNGDGRFDQDNVDGWSLGGGVKKSTDRFVFPHRETLVLDGALIRYRVHADGSRVDYDSGPIEAGRGILAGLLKLNELRMQNGLLPVGLDRDYSEKAAKHVRYMERNDAFGHYEEKGHPGYTEEGAWAGIWSVIDYLVTPEEASERWWATLYHRRPLSTQRLVSVGAAEGDPYAMLVPKTENSVPGIRWPGIVPAPNSHGVPTHAGRENPLPFPEGEWPGYPIHLEFPGWNARVTNASAQLESVDKKGRVKGVRFYYSDLEKPAHPSRSGNDGCICLIPKEPLRPMTTYRVHVRYTWRGTPGERKWVFHTGAKRIPPGKYKVARPR